MHIFFLLSFSSGNSNGKDRALAALLFVCSQVKPFLPLANIFRCPLIPLTMEMDEMDNNSTWIGRPRYLFAFFNRCVLPHLTGHRLQTLCKATVATLRAIAIAGTCSKMTCVHIDYIIDYSVVDYKVQ